MSITADAVRPASPEFADGEIDLSADDAAPSRRGRVKWFNDAKGFGFLLDAEGRDVFVHYAVIEGNGFKSLDEDEVVSYEAESGPKGLRATRVQRHEDRSRGHRR